MAASWALAISLTGGFVLRIGWIRISSRAPRNALLIALVSGVAAAALTFRHGRRGFREDRLWLGRTTIAAAAYLRNRWRRFQQVGIAPAVAIAGSGLIVVLWMTALPLWLDEEMIALNVRDRSLLELAGPLWLGQSAPYGWLALLRAQMTAFGTSELALRAVPAAFGIATLMTALWIGRRWMGPVGSAVLVLLCAIGQWLPFYSLVLKPYSADAFWALLLPALGAWAVDSDADEAVRRRLTRWWMAAALGLWFANGALFVTPACALVLSVFVWRRHGPRAARRFVLLGIVWSVAFGLHYLVSIRHALHSAYLQDYWAWAMPPASAGAVARLAWLGARLEPLADIPGGTTLPSLFWILAACGFALSTPRTLGVLFATVPLSAFVLAAFRFVPLYERLSLWIAPALYVGIALFCDAVARFVWSALSQRRWIGVALSIVIAGLAAGLCLDIFTRGRQHLLTARDRDDTMQLDDRAAVRWLMRYQQPGSALLTTHLALPAVWWYGPINPTTAGDVLEVSYRAPGSHCDEERTRNALKDRRRLLVYFGFRQDMPDGFDGLLLRTLNELGTVVAFSDFTERGRAAVVDLHPSAPSAPRASPNARSGCVVIQQARRW